MKRKIMLIFAGTVAVIAVALCLLALSLVDIKPAHEIGTTVIGNWQRISTRAYNMTNSPAVSTFEWERQGIEITDTIRHGDELLRLTRKVCGEDEYPLPAMQQREMEARIRAVYGKRSVIFGLVHGYGWNASTEVRAVYSSIDDSLDRPQD